MALRVGVNAMEKANARLIDNRRMNGVQRILEQEIAGFMPVVATCLSEDERPPTPLPFFQGEPESMRLVSTYSLSDAWRGYPQILEFQVIAGALGEGVRLVVNEHLYTGPPAAGVFCLGLRPDDQLGVSVPVFRPIAVGPGSFVLADRLAFCRFSYLERLAAAARGALGRALDTAPLAERSAHRDGAHRGGRRADSAAFDHGADSDYRAAGRGIWWIRRDAAGRWWRCCGCRRRWGPSLFRWPPRCAANWSVPPRKPTARGPTIWRPGGWSGRCSTCSGGRSTGVRTAPRSTSPLKPRGCTSSSPPGEADVEILPESARLNLNQARPEDLLRLLTALGAERGRAVEITRAVLDWRTRAPATAPSRSSTSITSPSLRLFRPLHASFRETEELLLVKGMTPELYYGSFERDPQGQLRQVGGLGGLRHRIRRRRAGGREHRAAGGPGGSGPRPQTGGSCWCRPGDADAAALVEPLRAMGSPTEVLGAAGDRRQPDLHPARHGEHAVAPDGGLSDASRSVGATVLLRRRRPG